MQNRFLVFLVFVLVFVVEMNAQQKALTRKAQKENTSKTDSLQKIFLSADSTIDKDSESKPASIINKIEDIYIKMTKYENFLNRGFDTSEIEANLETIESTIQIIDSNLVNSQNISQMNLRNVSSFKVVMVQFNKQLKRWNEELETFTASVTTGYQNIKAPVKVLTSFSSEEDSLQKVNFGQQLKAIADNSIRLRNKKDSLFTSLLEIEERVVKAFVKNASLLDNVQYRISKYSTTVFNKSHQVFWNDSKNNFATPLGYDIRYTFKRVKSVLFYYFKNNIRSLLLLIGLFIAFYGWIASNKRFLKKNNLGEMLKPLLYVLKYPMVSTTLFFCFIGPYFFMSPPAALVELLWILASICTTYFFWYKETITVRYLWILLLFIGSLLGLDNLLYDYSIGERWAIMICNIAIIVICSFILSKNLHSKNKYDAVLKFSLLLAFIGSVLAIFLNLFGYFALAKLVSNSSVKQFILAVCLSFITEILTEAVYLQLERMKSTQSSAYLEYENIRNKFKGYLNVGAIALWFLGFIWSLSFHDIALQFFIDFFEYPIAIGNLSFTLNAAFIFGITIWVSVLISNLLAVIFGTTEQQFASTKKSKVGSWMMLIRVGIISIGFFIAVGAAGIPIDKLAIVFGALSVGIGFGLQNIVGNLISGVILAFEKPMQVGDVVEIGTQTGIVKQIGIRSSKITTYDGADIIVPNGDFITQKLTNWTHSNSYRRIELIVGVAYGSSLDKVTNLINQLLSQRPDVMKYPSHNVIVQGFADSSVNFRILFWTDDFDNWIKLKSDVLKAIYQAFAENDIQIPFPQQDIYIKSMSDNNIIKPT